LVLAHVLLTYLELVALVLHLAAMRDPIDPKISKWPFFVGDVLLFGAAVFVYAQSKLPMGLWEMCFAGLCLAVGAVLGIAPFVLEYRATVKLAEADTLATTVAQIQNLEAIAAQIRSATGQWQEVQEQAGKTAVAAKEIAERMRAEVEAFMQFMQRMNESEKATLRLEVEKLRRTEGEWLQVLVLTLDHVYALLLAGRRSGQQNVIQQLTTFQHACRDVARKVGLIAFEAQSNEPFNAQMHQVLEGAPEPKPAAQIADTLAPGYTYQGQLIRNALVSIQADKVAKPEEDLLLA